MRIIRQTFTVSTKADIWLKKHYLVHEHFTCNGDGWTVKRNTATTPHLSRAEALGHTHVYMHTITPVIDQGI